MAIKTKIQLHALSDSTYETNRTGNITAELVRTFNTDLIDSLTIDSGWINLNITATSGSITVRSAKIRDYGPFCLIMLDVTLKNTVSTFTVSNAFFGTKGVGGAYTAGSSGTFRVSVFTENRNVQFVAESAAETIFKGTVIVTRQ